MHLPIRVRLTVVATVLMGVVLMVVGALGLWRFDAQLTQTVDAGLGSRAEQLVGAASTGGSPTGSGALVDADEAFSWVVDADGAVLFASPGVDGEAPPEPSGGWGGASATFFEASVATNEELVPARLLAVSGPNETTVVVGVSLEEQQDAQTQLLRVGIAGGAATLALSALVIWLVTGAALRPVEQMRREAASVTPAGPGHRLQVPDTGDELARLAETLNAMLDRLDVALLRERRLIGDASHELRTPLANLRAEIDVALRVPDDAARLSAALISAGEETDRLTRLVQELLVLARADQGELALQLESVDLSTFVRQVVAAFAARSDQLGVEIAVASPESLSLVVDPGRIRQALENLVDNALRHSPSGGLVEVAITSTSGRGVIRIVDAGPGFDPEFLPAAFEPFTRSDSGRARVHGGAGLGLAIVRAIVVAHGGEVTASNRDGGGGEVAISLPLGGPGPATAALTELSSPPGDARST